MRKSKSAFAATLVGATLVLSACGPKPDASGYGETAEEHFLEGCERTWLETDDGVVAEPLARESTCQCVYDAIRTDNPEAAYPIPWDDLRAYEDQVEDADEGAVPDPPSELVDAVNLCTTAGPSPSGSSEDSGSE